MLVTKIITVKLESPSGLLGSSSGVLDCSENPFFHSTVLLSPTKTVTMAAYMVQGLTTGIRLSWLTQRGAGVYSFALHLFVCEFICVPSALPSPVFSLYLFLSSLALTVSINLSYSDPNGLTMVVPCCGTTYVVSLSNPAWNHLQGRRLLHSKGRLGWIMSSGVLCNSLY